MNANQEFHPFTLRIILNDLFNKKKYTHQTTYGYGLLRVLVQKKTLRTQIQKKPLFR